MPESVPILERALVRRLLVGLVVALALSAVLALAADADALLDAAREVPTSAVLAALLASTGNYVLRGLRWDLYLRKVGAEAPVVDRWLVFLAGFSMSLTPGKVGELLKPGLLHARHGTPLAPVSSIVVAERITDLLGVAALLGMGALAWPRVAPVAAIVWVIVLLGTVALASARLSGWIVSVVARLPVVGRFAEPLGRLFEALRALSAPATLIPALALSIGAWGLQCVSLYLIAAALPEVALTPLEAVLGYTAPLLAGAAALVPGGIGVAEATMAGLLTEITGGPLPAAAAVTALVRGVTLWWAVLLGLGALALWGWRGRESSSPR